MPGSETIAGSILRAADQVFRETGFQRAEMRSIADRAGIAVGTIYNYFPNKWGLFLRVLYHNWDHVEKDVQRQRAEAETSWRDKALGILGTQMAYVADNAPIWSEIEAMATSGNRLPAGGDPGIMRQVMDWLVNQLSEVLAESGRPEWRSAAARARWALSLVAVGGALARKLPREHEANLRFLGELLPR